MNDLDSSGWIEFFKAGANGPIFKPVIEDRALEADLRRCLVDIRNQAWSLYA